MRCKLCYSPAVAPVPFAVPAAEGAWVRCRDCGSDSSSSEYDPGIYTPAYLMTHASDSPDPDRMREQVRSNCDWFGHHAGGLPNRDFLDVGCADGAALAVMQELGWSVHGFDVAMPPYGPAPHVTVAPFFHRWLFPLRYAAVMAREVLEHVPAPDLFLHELHGVCIPGGLVQVQTPKPGDYPHPAVYQRAHLCVASPRRLRQMLAAAMLDVIDAREWDADQPGQAYLCRART